MYLYTPRHLGLAISLLQQPRRFHPPLLQCVKISANSRWIAHARQDSTIFQKCQYIVQYSIVTGDGRSSAEGGAIGTAQHSGRNSQLPSRQPHVQNRRIHRSSRVFVRSTVVEVKGSHAIYVSQPEAVAALIKQAAKSAKVSAAA